MSDSNALCDRFTRSEIELHLDRVLNSAAFRSSRRSQDFLRYVVTRTLEGQGDSLKERNIAIEVFGRGLNYNSSEDSFVRVKASEVRRRLATYYAEAPSEDILRIEIPLGNYVPNFVQIEAPATASASQVQEVAPESPKARRRRRWLLPAVGTALALTMVMSAALLHSFRGHSVLDGFWAPILKTPEPLVIFLASRPSYQEAGETGTQLFPDQTWAAVNSAGMHSLFILNPPTIGEGDVLGAIRFVDLCARIGKPYVIKVGDDLSFSDLRNAPAVILGAFSSKWSLMLNNDYRFRFVKNQDDSFTLVDSKNPSRQWHATKGTSPNIVTEDYAVAGRVFDSESGRPVIIAAGISTFGTEAAAEFLTDPSSLAELAQRARQPLSQANFQVVLEIRVLGNTPTPPRIIDAQFW
jgi:hypothetical protein